MPIDHETVRLKADVHASHLESQARHLRDLSRAPGQRHLSEQAMVMEAASGVLREVCTVLDQNLGQKTAEGGAHESLVEILNGLRPVTFRMDAPGAWSAGMDGIVLLTDAGECPLRGEGATPEAAAISLWNTVVELNASDSDCLLVNAWGGRPTFRLSDGSWKLFDVAANASPAP